MTDSPYFYLAKTCFWENHTSGNTTSLGFIGSGENV